MTVASLVGSKDVVIVCGSGGVGKTTTAAAIATMAAMESERRVLVITIDPARRLADALGIGALTNDPAPVPLEGAKGSLFAAMLDAKKAWDELVHRHAPDRRTAKAILSSPLYTNISGRFVQSHDYIAMERLYELKNSGKFDLLVIDTPPSSHAIDFLEAPARMAKFFDSTFLRVLVAPSKSLFTNLASRPFLQVADRILGKRFLADITGFFQLLDTMRPGFIERARDVEALLQSGRTTFFAVTTLEPAPRKEAMRFIEALSQRRLELGAIVLNRVLPPALLDDQAAAVARDLQQKESQLAKRLAETSEDEKKIARVLEELSSNFFRLRTVALSEQKEQASLSSYATVTATVPWLGEELQNMNALLHLGKELWK